MSEKEFLNNMKKIGLFSLDIEQALMDIATYVKQKEVLADERLKKLQEYNKEEEIKKLLDEIEVLRRRSVALLSQKEIKSKREFTEKHYNSCKSNIELLISNTGIGYIIKCKNCGTVEDITDLNCW